MLIAEAGAETLHSNQQNLYFVDLKVTRFQDLLPSLLLRLSFILFSASDSVNLFFIALHTVRLFLA